MQVPERAITQDAVNIQIVVVDNKKLAFSAVLFKIVPWFLIVRQHETAEHIIF